MTARGRSPASAPPAIEVPEPGAEVGAAEHRVGGDAEEQDDRDRVAHAHPTGTVSSELAGDVGRRAVRHVGLVDARLGSRQRRLMPPQHEDRRDADHRRRCATTARNVIQTPCVVVAASSTFM